MTSNAETIEAAGLEPARVWRLFAELSDVPRPSKREERIRRHVRGVAETHGLKVDEDAAGNLLVTVPATAGRENAPITVLQSHLDMVGEKNSGTEHDFDKDPIRLIVTTDAASGEPIVHADGTTLGADNGVGVAMALAAAISDDVAHGPLELLFTIDEEAGMTGAKALTPQSFKGRRLINLDSEEDNALYIGCAGGCDTNLTFTFDTAGPEEGAEIGRVTVSGLRGGHSGGDIHENRGNAIKLLASALIGAGVETLRIGEISGGSKRNAIPREACAVVCGPAGTLAALRASAERIRADAAEQSNEPGVAIGVEELPGGDPGAPGNVLIPSDSWRLLSALAGLPSGVLGMYPSVPGLVQTSNNVSTVVSQPSADGKRMRVEVGNLSRSSSEPWMRATCVQIAAIGRLANAEVTTGNEYPGWDPNPKSPLLATTGRVYESLFGEPANVAAIHAGLECGIIGERVGDMDMVSFGPTITGAHSPDERVYINAVQKSWKYLAAVLDELSKS